MNITNFNQRGGLERRITKPETFKRFQQLGSRLERRRPILDATEDMLEGFFDRRGPAHFAPVANLPWPRCWISALMASLPQGA